MTDTWVETKVYDRHVKMKYCKNCKHLCGSYSVGYREAVCTVWVAERVMGMLDEHNLLKHTKLA